MGHSNDGIIIRTSWVMGPVGKNFAKTILELLKNKDEIKVVSDQIGAPTTTFSLAEYCWKIICLSKENGYIPNILHYTNSGVASWYDIAVAIKEIGLELGLLNNDVTILPIKTIDYPTPATRPPYSVLDCSSSYNFLNLKSSIHWRSALKKILESPYIT